MHIPFGPEEPTSPPEHVIFARNGQTATYEVTGSKFSYSIRLVG
jgi:hypothetical protein